MTPPHFLPDWCRKHILPGTVAFDIGAHVGEYLPDLSEGVGPTGHVVAIEPSPLVLRVLLPVATALGNVMVYPVAFGEASGLCRVFHYRHFSLLPAVDGDPRRLEPQYHPGERTDLKGEFTATFTRLDVFAYRYLGSPLRRSAS